MRKRPVAAAAAALVLTAGVVAGCGGSSDTVTTTITTDSLPATTTAPSSSTAPATGATTSATTASVVVGEDRLPPGDALANLKSGTVRVIDTPTAFVDALYQAADPTKPAAVARLTAAGYAGGALRDQEGTDPTAHVALFRSYAIALRDDAAARAEVTAAVQEVRDSTTAPTTDIDVSDIPGAEGLHVEIDQGGVKGAVAFVTFPAGAYVYGLQGVSTDNAALPQDEILGAARDLYENVTAAP